MTTTTDLPTLDGMTVHYGVPVTFVGDDGDIAVMLGHIEPRRALAALNRTVRVDLSYRLTDETERRADEILDSFEHRWAFLMTHCDDHPGCVRKATYFGEEVCVPCKEIQDAGWWMNYSKDNTADTPGAFPITFFEM